jgi:hypothetical protein
MSKLLNLDKLKVSIKTHTIVWSRSETITRRAEPSSLSIGNKSAEEVAEDEMLLTVHFPGQTRHTQQCAPYSSAATWSTTDKVLLYRKKKRVKG